MQREEITFKGVNLTPYADHSPDGQLTVSDGLELYNGSLRPSILSGTRSQWNGSDGSAWLLMHIHATPSYSHYIFYNSSTSTVCWAKVQTGTINGTPIAISGLGKVTSIASVGNTLTVFTDKGLEYVLYDNGTYRHIGKQPPELNISFGLSGYWLDVLSSESKEKFVFDEFSQNNVTDLRKQLTFEMKDDQRKTIANKAFAAINKTMEQCSTMGRFCQPFFVRAAYRRFDGTYTMLTPPVLMIPDSTGPKAVLKEGEYRVIQGKNTAEFVEGYLYGRALAAALTAKIMGDINSINSWTDIIAGVDIFVTPPADVFPKDGEAAGLYGPSIYDDPLKEWLGWYKPPVSYGVYSEAYDATSLYGRHDYDWISNPSVRNIILPTRTDDEILSQLVSLSQFYKIYSISLSDLSSGSDRFAILSPDLKTLTLQESLPDSADYQSHDTLIAERGFVYNKRLHLYDIQRTLFSGFQAEAMFPYTNDGTGARWHIYTYIATDDGQDRCVHSVSATTELVRLGQFLYYPNPDAYRMVIQKEGTSTQWDLTLAPHPFLNGAYAMWLNSEPAAVAATTQTVANASISTPGKVYTSEVDNPYYFPLEGIYTVGVGRILGMSSVATALSQGQFGQFPLILFCTDGNYALSVDSEGYYSTVHPVQRDVCTSPQSITQTDSEIIYMSSRGAMSTSGISASCFSTALDGVPGTIPSQINVTLPPGQPHDSLENSLIAYDYASRRVLFFVKDTDLAYVYSLNDGTWCTAHFGQVKAVLNYYPYAYIQFADGSIMRLDDVYNFSASSGQVKGTLYTRPVKLSSYQRKRLHQIAVQGVFTDTQQVLVYASNDGISWHHIGSTSSVRKGAMRGRPFKYYRFALITSLQANEHITSIKVEFDILPESKLR